MQANLQAHPAAQMFPMMSTQEYTFLENDIIEHGVREPIWMFNGQVLDGRNRYGVCQRHGIECETREFKGTEAEAIAFVWSLNFARRHLNQSQAAMAAAKRANLERGRPANGDETNPPSGGITQEQAAEITGASLRSTQRAAEVLEKGTPELVKLVESGDIPVATAARIATTTPKSKQMKAVRERKEKPKNGAPKKDGVPKKEATKTVAATEYAALFKEHKELIEQFNALQDNRDGLASELEATEVVALKGDASVIKIKQLQLELKTCKRTRDELMTKTNDLTKQCAMWKKSAEKLGWKPKESSK